MTFIADVRTAKIADLVVMQDGSVADGTTANTLQVKVTDAFGNALAGQTVSVLADNGATVALTVTTQPDGTVEISVTSQTAGVSTVTASINNSSQSRNVTFIADVRTAQIADLGLLRTAQWQTVRRRTRCGRGSPMRSGMRLPGRRSACWRTTAQRCLRRSPQNQTARWTVTRTAEISVTSQTVRTAQIAELVVVDNSGATSPFGNTRRSSTAAAGRAGT